MKARRNPWLIAAFGLAILATTVFGIRALWIAWELSVRAERPVAGWMTPRYIVTVYDVEPADLAALLQIAPESEPRESIAHLAETTGQDPKDVLQRIEALIAAGRAPE